MVLVIVMRWLCQAGNSKLELSVKTGYDTRCDGNPLHQKCLECWHLGFEHWAVRKVCGHRQFDATRNLLCWRQTQISRNPNLFELVSLVGLLLAADRIADCCSYVCWMLIQQVYVAWSSPTLWNRCMMLLQFLQRICAYRHLIYL
jgi:hypothetical protein